jgi:hypothetical protein
MKKTHGPILGAGFAISSSKLRENGTKNQSKLLTLGRISSLSAINAIQLIAQNAQPIPFSACIHP